MRPSVLLAVTGMLFCLPALLPANAQDHGLQSLLSNKNKQIGEAIVKGDLAPVRDLFAPSATIVNPAGGVASYYDFSALLKSGTLKYTATDVSEEKLIQLGKVAVLIYISKDVGTLQNHDISNMVRRMEVWGRQSGEWKIVAVQSTPVIPDGK